jgi:hypothetical protein
MKKHKKIVSKISNALLQYRVSLETDAKLRSFEERDAESCGPYRLEAIIAASQ